MNDIVSRFLTFDKLIATGLIKLLYWIGLVAIGLGTLIGFVGAFGQFGSGFVQGIGALILTPVGGVLAIIFWRFLCEVYIVIFGIYDRLGEIRTDLKKD